METIPHYGQIRMETVIRALSRVREPLTARTYYNPNPEEVYPGGPQRGTYNIEGRILGLLGVDPDYLGSLTAPQVRIIFADGLLGSSALQRGILPYLDGPYFPLRLRTGQEAARILNHPDLILGGRAGAIASLAELVHRYPVYFCNHTKLIDWLDGGEQGKKVSNAASAKNSILKAAEATFQTRVFAKDPRYLANFAAQDIIRQVGLGLPNYILEIICLAANEIQLENDGRIAFEIDDPDFTKGRHRVYRDLFFLPRLADPSGQPLTLGFLQNYIIEGWSAPTGAEAIKRDTKRFFDLVRSHRRARRNKSQGA